MTNQTKELNIDQLVQDDKNFNKGTAEGQKLMDKSLGQFGAGRSILIDKNDRIIAGNKTAATYQALGNKKVRVIETTGDELIAVKRIDVDLDSKEGREMALADNATSKANLDWDEEVMADVFEEYGIEGDDWGIDACDALEPEVEQQATEDEFDENTDVVETVCQPGDLWKLGEHRLKCGDSTKLEDVQDLMQGELADLWLTDPPYNVAVKNSQGMTIANDNLKNDEFAKFLQGAFKSAVAVMSNGCPFYIWYATCEHINFEQSANYAGLKVRQQLIWNKNHFTLGRSHYQWKHEPCLYGWKGGSCKYFVDSRAQASVIADSAEINVDKMKVGELREMLKQILADKIATTVINENKPTKDTDHPTMKPVRLFGYQICNSSKKGDIVLDSFGGSGTTIVACDQLGRKARLMEYDPHYCDVIIARWEKMTGKKAQKITPGQ